MAGENSLPTQYYHDDQQVVCEVLIAPAAATPILYADRNLIIDSVVVGVYTVSAGITATIQKTVGATNDGITITPVSPAAASPQTLMATGTIPVATAGTYVVSTESATRSLSADHNTLDAGNWLLFVPSASATGAVLSVQVRFRSRPK